MVEAQTYKLKFSPILANISIGLQQIYIHKQHDSNPQDQSQA